MHLPPIQPTPPDLLALLLSTKLAGWGAGDYSKSRASATPVASIAHGGRIRGADQRAGPPAVQPHEPQVLKLRTRVALGQAASAAATSSTIAWMTAMSTSSETRSRCCEAALSRAAAAITSSSRFSPARRPARRTCRLRQGGARRDRVDARLVRGRRDQRVQGTIACFTASAGERTDTAADAVPLPPSSSVTRRELYEPGAVGVLVPGDQSRRRTHR